MNAHFKQAVDQLAETGSLKLQGQSRLLLELFVTSRNKKQIVITKDPSEFSKRLRNFRFFCSGTSKEMRALPAAESSIMHATAIDPMLTMDRTAVRFAIAEGQSPDILVLPPIALLEKFPNAGDLRKHAQLLLSGDTVDREQLIKSLFLLGYSRVPIVLDRGTFAVRGSIIDIFVNGSKNPVRIDLFGDLIESLRFFDPNTQRSNEKVDSILIGGVREIYFDDESKEHAEQMLTNLADQLNFPTQKLNEKIRDINNSINFYGIEKMLPAFFADQCSLLQLILSVTPKENLPDIVFDDRDRIFLELSTFQKSTTELYEEALYRQELIFSPETYYTDLQALNDLLSNFSIVDINNQSSADSLDFPSSDLNDIRQEILLHTSASKDEEAHLLKPLAQRVKTYHADTNAVFICVSSREHEIELKNLLQPFGLNISSFKGKPHWDLSGNEYFKPHIHAYTLVNKNALAFGALFKFLKIAVIAEDDIFGQRKKRKGTSGKQQGFGTTLSDLDIGDLVVHVDHGIGRFAGLVRLTMRGIESDFILLYYAKDEKLYLPIHRINLIKAHGAAKDDSVRVDKLGGTAWQSKKTKVKEAVLAMAQDLIKLYAKRSVVERPPFAEPDNHFREFEAAFQFECTPDQDRAIQDILRDMQRQQPMDRLVCGDVGYGKTEVAMRASMLAVLSGRQVAVLAPTTVLAQQHGITFSQRFKSSGAKVAVLSRFQKTSEIKEVLEKVKKNQLDIIIGTHRLLSPDVHFHDLGLMVVDEEQRFGIKAKEHLKKMRSNVDVLTMSATPIPRTLQMGLFGIRDLSVIETPPVDRRAIQTNVVQFDDALIKEAVLREISRGGQVYFVHNRVSSINATADYLKRLVPEANIGVAHGQMPEDELEKKMLSFLAHEINVLVCTTIIETGIDVGTANTMFIDNADDFGLSQLYQLRGRIGRSSERAFAYLLTRGTHEQLTPIARKRLEILHRFSELGAGFRIAQHDLELRGAGDLLGQNQHGHMAAVGYDLYAELLNDAVKSLQGQKDQESIDPEVVFPMSAMIPEKYCPDLHDRLSFYQRFASADSPTALEGVQAELEDLIGEAPIEVLALKTNMLIKLALKEIYALKLEISVLNPGQYSVAILPSQKTPIILSKLKELMTKDSGLRITPQHKVIQIINSSSEQPAVFYEIALKAIAEFKQKLYNNNLN